MAASATPPPFDGPHWKPVAKVIETFHARWGILAADKFNAQTWWYRWSTASGWPRRLVHTVLPPESRIEFDSDILDLDHEDEIEIRLNGEACIGWLAVWAPPATAESSSPPASPTQPELAAPSPPLPLQKHAGGRDPDHDWESAVCSVDQEVVDHGPLRRHKTGKNAGKPIHQHAVDLILGYFANQPNIATTAPTLRDGWTLGTGTGATGGYDKTAGNSNVLAYPVTIQQNKAYQIVWALANMPTPINAPRGVNIILRNGPTNTSGEQYVRTRMGYSNNTGESGRTFTSGTAAVRANANFTHLVIDPASHFSGRFTLARVVHGMTSPTERTVQKWVTNNPERCRHWWG